MTPGFYDKVAEEFGLAGFEVDRLTEYHDGAPEEVFEQRLVDLGGDAITLDAGCGNGLFTLQMASRVREITGIDTSQNRLGQAREQQRAGGVGNVRFMAEDAGAMSFADGTFDLVYSRRGPTTYQEFHRVTKPGGHLGVVGIGEKDAWALKLVFGRGQGFHEWPATALQQTAAQLRQVGYAMEYQRDFFFDEYYACYADLETFLRGVPIFEDFDPTGDRPLLEAYVAGATTSKGIHLSRHRFVAVAVKPRAPEGSCA